MTHQNEHIGYEQFLKENDKAKKMFLKYTCSKILFLTKLQDFHFSSIGINAS